MGAVTRRGSRLDRLVALKILPPTPAATRVSPSASPARPGRWRRLNHPNIVAVHDFGAERAGCTTS